MRHLEQLEENVRVMVADAERRPEPVKIGLATELRTNRLLLLGAWEALAQLGTRPRQRVAADVEWARALVNEIVLRLGLKSNEGRLRTLVLVAQGIVDVIVRQIQAYHQERHR
jgi:hypothetical protein